MVLLLMVFVISNDLIKMITNRQADKPPAASAPAK
jgi:hypothetical protein